MAFKLFIPAAGTGSRLGEACRFLNKSLVSVGNRPTICHIIEKFDPGVGIVVALGYKGALVREFLEMAYPDRNFEFAEVRPFEGPGSGLGVTLLASRSLLQCPFVFCSCDTIVSGPIPEPDANWVGYDEVADAAPYRTIGLIGDRAAAILEKGDPAAGPAAYIGLAGIRDYGEFWAAMADGALSAAEQGESHGLRRLLDSHSVAAYRFPWHDTGSPDSLARAREALRPKNAPNILPKANEDIWFVNGSVIKFSSDATFIADRASRSRQLNGYCPKIEAVGSHMYKYRRAEGEIFSEAVTLPRFRRLLAHAQDFWRPKPLSGPEAAKFEAVCLDFYRAKTHQRVEQFYRNFDRTGSAIAINGVPVPSDADLLAQVDWKWLSQGRPGNFHGDFHFENILYEPAADRFVFLDWRQNFGGLMEVGDIYYDLAKLNHGLIVCHELVARDLFKVEEGPGGVRFELLRKQSLVDCEAVLDEFLQAQGYDRKRVQMLTALIYLNIAALHHHPYSLLLYYLGRSMLADQLLPRCPTSP